MTHGYEWKNPLGKNKNGNIFSNCMMIGVNEKIKIKLLGIFGILWWWHMGMNEKSPPKINKNDAIFWDFTMIGINENF